VKIATKIKEYECLCSAHGAEAKSVCEKSARSFQVKLQLLKTTVENDVKRLYHKMGYAQS
jgi:hypothetical protein